MFNLNSYLILFAARFKQCVIALDGRGWTDNREYALLSLKYSNLFGS